MGKTFRKIYLDEFDFLEPVPQSKRLREAGRDKSPSQLELFPDLPYSTKKTQHHGT